MVSPSHADPNGREQESTPILVSFQLKLGCGSRAMGDIKDLDSTAIYAYTTLISVIICVPAAIIFEGPTLKTAVEAAVKSHPNFYKELLAVGLLYHLYNQVRIPHVASLVPFFLSLFSPHLSFFPPSFP